MPTYDLGDGVSLEQTVRDVTGALTAATVSIVLTRPDGTTFPAPTISNPSTGVYRVVPVPDQIGAWAGVWTTSGNVISVTPFTFTVADPGPAAYADLSLVKSMLGKSSDDDRDDLIQQAITASARWIDRRCGRYFYLDRTASMRTFRAQGATIRVQLDQVLTVDDIGLASGVTVAVGTTGTYVPLTTFDLGPFNVATRNLPYTEIRSTWGWLTSWSLVQVTARWGWPTPPDEIVQANALLAARWYRRKDSPQGVLGSADWGLMRVSRTDPDVEALLAPFINPVIA
jgi:hypothetical protein